MELTANQMQDIFFQAIFLNTINKDVIDLLSDCIKTEKITVNKSTFTISYLSYEKMLSNFDKLKEVYSDICMLFPENADSSVNYDDVYKAEIEKSIEGDYSTEPKSGFIWIGTDDKDRAVYVREFIGGYPRVIIKNELEQSFNDEFNKKVKDEKISNYKVNNEKINFSEEFFKKLSSTRTFYAYDRITQRKKGIDNPYKAFKAYAKGEYSKLYIGCENYSKLKEEIVTKSDEKYLSEYKNKTWAELYQEKGQIIELDLSDSIKTELLIKHGLESMILFLTSVYENPCYFVKKNYLNVLKMIKDGRSPKKDNYIEKADFTNYTKALFVCDKISQSNFLDSFAPNSLNDLKPNLRETWRHTHKISTIDKDQIKLDLYNDDIGPTGMILKNDDASLLKSYAKKTLDLINNRGRYKNRFINELANKIYNLRLFFNGRYSLDVLIDELGTSEYIKIIELAEQIDLKIFDSKEEKNKIINLMNNYYLQVCDNSIDEEDEHLFLDNLKNDSNILTDFDELKENEKVLSNSILVFSFLKAEIEKYFIFDENFKDYLINYFQTLAYKYLCKNSNNASAIKHHELSEIDIEENYDIWKPELKRIVRKIITDYESNIVKEDLLFKFTGISYGEYKNFVAEYKNKHIDNINSYVKGRSIPAGHKEAGYDATERERILLKDAFEEFYNTNFSNGDCFRNLDSIVNYKISGRGTKKTPYKEDFEGVINRFNKLFISWHRILKTYLRTAWKKYSEENENLKSIKIDELLNGKIDDFTYQKLVFQTGFEIISSRTEKRNVASSELWDNFYTKKYLDITNKIKADKRNDDKESKQEYIYLRPFNGFYNRTEFNKILNLIYKNLSELTKDKADFYIREDPTLRKNMEESFKHFFNKEESNEDDKSFFKFINRKCISKICNKSMALSLFDMLEEKNRSFYFLILNKPCNKSSSSFEIQNLAYIDTLERVKEDFIKRSGK